MTTTLLVVILAFVVINHMAIRKMKAKLDRLAPDGNAVPNNNVDEDTVYEEAKKIVLESHRASTPLLQRKLRVGYARAARLLDMLEEEGIVGPANGAEPREVFEEK